TSRETQDGTTLPHVPSTITTDSVFSTRPVELSCIDIKACSDDRCNQYISQVFSVEGSSGLSTTVITTGNETSTCVSVYVGKTVNVSAMCSNGDVVNTTVIPTTVSTCSESGCVELLFVIGCIQSSTESATTVPDIPLGTRTPEEPNSVTQQIQ
ncbi:uncharacterized protein LOC117110422, partial [Anneissia japonica]|uniref:uncharacterized protein LOC117110422 n=1 Tax=Anneissia japonica TaxID=1529436 RepID=UPI001425A1D1